MIGPLKHSLPVVVLFTSCYTWTPSVAPARVWEGEQAARVLAPCTRRAPGPVDSLWTPDTAVVRRMEVGLRAYLERRWSPGDNATWVFDGDVAGFYSGGRRLVYGTYTARRSDEPTIPRRGDAVMVWCDGGPRFFGVTYDPDRDRIIEYDQNGTVSVRGS